MDNLVFLAIVPALIWLGVFVYILMVDRKLARLESTREEDEL